MSIFIKKSGKSIENYVLENLVGPLWRKWYFITIFFWLGEAIRQGLIVIYLFNKIIIAILQNILLENFRSGYSDVDT